MKFFDNSRLDLFRTCPLKYCLRHKKGWCSERPNHAPGFGSCVHAGLEKVYLGVKEGDLDINSLWDKANAAFDAEWIEREMPLLNDPSTEEFKRLEKPGRLPAHAKDLFFNYLQKYLPWMEKIEVMHVEKPYVVKAPVDYDEDIYLTGRYDLVYRDKQGIWIKDHKTSTLYRADNKKTGVTRGFQWKFSARWILDPQVEQYTWSAVQKWGKDVRGMIIDGLCNHKVHHDIFKEIPVIVDQQGLRAFERDIQYWIKQIMELEADNDEFSTNWPRNLSGCQTPYGFCEFHGACSVLPNPQILQAPPEGLKVEHWTPFDEVLLEKLITEEKEGV